MDIWLHFLSLCCISSMAVLRHLKHGCTVGMGCSTVGGRSSHCHRIATSTTSASGQGDVTGVQALLAALLIVGSGVASTTLWFFSQRYVGELAALPPTAPGGRERLRFSVLDFWGKRQVRLYLCRGTPCEGATRRHRLAK